MYVKPTLTTYCERLDMPAARVACERVQLEGYQIVDFRPANQEKSAFWLTAVKVDHVRDASMEDLQFSLDRAIHWTSDESSDEEKK